MYASRLASSPGVILLRPQGPHQCADSGVHISLLTFSEGRACVAGRMLRLTDILGLEIPTGPKGETE